MDNEKLLKDKTILITGANGILELRVIRKLLNLNTAIRIIGIDHRTDNVSDPEKAYCRKQILRAVSEHPERQWKMIQADISDKAVVEMVFQIYRPDIVIHLGTLTVGSHEESAYRKDFACDCFFNILEACRHSQERRHSVSHLIYGADLARYKSDRKRIKTQTDIYSRSCQMVVTVLRLQPYDELSGNADTLDLIGDTVIDALLHSSAMQAACICI